ncbi:er lumen protein-retaining receptor [Quercus suber]|uniref:ER lumen protein-retaining receptor n=1 Tax=Quercus suber TaxID=58331 RepID=A0AAW0JJU4_QUESU
MLQFQGKGLTAVMFALVLWSFSLYLEAVAILPQLVLLQRSRNIDTLTGDYVFLLGDKLKGRVPGGKWDEEIVGHGDHSEKENDRKMRILSVYRVLYLLNWVYRFFMEIHQIRWIPWVSGLIQTALYADFFYYYIKSWKNREKLKLPA